MSTNYIDTLTIYYNCPHDIRTIFTKHWIYDSKNTDANFHHFCFKTDYCFLNFYPNLYGFHRLCVTFSLPKMYHKSGNNTFNVTDYDNHTFMQRLTEELSQALDVSALPTEIKDWQPSRVDLFYMRKINPVDRKEYFYGYGRLSYRGVSATTYKNTDYLTSSKSAKRIGILLRMYNKNKEISDKKLIREGGIPLSIEEEQDNLMRELDIPNEYFRYEFASIRSAVRRVFDKLNIPLNLENVMREDIQKIWFNKLIMSRGLNCSILSKKDFRNTVNKIFPTKATRNNAIKLAEAIRNKKPISLSESQRYRIQRELKSYFISTATTQFKTIEGLKLL